MSFELSYEADLLLRLGVRSDHLFNGADDECINILGEFD